VVKTVMEPSSCNKFKLKN